MLSFIRGIFTGKNGQITSAPTGSNPITAEQVLGSLLNLPSGRNLATLLIENSMDSSLYCYAPLIAAERFLSESIAALPCLVYARDGEAGKDRADEHPIYSLLKTAPNNFQVPFIFFKTLIQNAIRYGNGYVLIERNGAGEAANLIILDPQYCKVCFENGVKHYEYKSPGLTGTISNEDVIHILGFSNDGIIGIPLISYANRVIKLGLAVENYAQNFFTNTTASRGIIEMPPTITDAQYQQIVSSWKAAYTGAENQWTTPVLAYGAQWKDTGVPNNESQLIEVRKYQLLETSRLMRVPPYVIQHFETGGTYSNIEAQGIDLVKNSLQPWITQIEQELTAKLFKPADKQLYFIEFLIDSRLRGDTVSRYSAYKLGREAGFLSVNDIRDFENLPRIEGGDDYLVTPVGASPNPSSPSDNAAEPATEEPADDVAEEAAPEPTPAAETKSMPVIQNYTNNVAKEAAKAVAKKRNKK